MGGDDTKRSSKHKHKHDKDEREHGKSKRKHKSEKESSRKRSRKDEEHLRIVEGNLAGHCKVTTGQTTRTYGQYNGMVGDS